MKFPYIYHNRYYSSEHLAFWSLLNLASYIGKTYHSLLESNCNIFPNLTPENVVDIKNRILGGKYTLSSLRAYEAKREDLVSPHFYHRIRVYYKDESHYLGIKPTEEDSLVLTALGMMLISHFNKVNLFNDYSLGCKTVPSQYYDIVSNKNNVLQLSVLDLTRSLYTVDVESLLVKLTNLVQNPDIMSLLRDYLNISIKDDIGDITTDLGLHIPSAGFITDVLLNLSLIDLDQQFSSHFPELDYIRYNQEVIVTIPISLKNQYNTISGMFEHQLFTLFEKLKLSGKIITIKPGDQPVPIFAYNGQISLTKEGSILIEYNKITNY